MKFGDYPKAASFDGVAGFRAHLASLGLDMPCDDIVAGGFEPCVEQGDLRGLAAALGAFEGDELAGGF